MTDTLTTALDAVATMGQDNQPQTAEEWADDLLCCASAPSDQPRHLAYVVRKIQRQSFLAGCAWMQEAGAKYARSLCCPDSGDTLHDVSLCLKIADAIEAIKPPSEGENIIHLLKQAAERVKNLAPEEYEAMIKAQQQSWTRQDND